jgi:hypothetical protein
VSSGEDKIDRSVRQCLDGCRRSQVPYTHLSRFLKSLQAGGEWSEDDISELQTRVIRVLLSESDDTHA